jgi:hypothetical protein
MKNQLHFLINVVLKTWLIFLIGFILIEGVIIVLDLLGYESKVEKIIKYLHL